MSKFKSLTEDKYKLSDIFTKHHEIWLMVPAVIYLLTPIVHMIVFAVLYKPQDDYSILDYLHFFETGEFAGDYYSPIIHYAFVLGAIFAVIAVITYLSFAKKTGYKVINADSIPLFFFIVYTVLIIISTIVNKTEIKLILGQTNRAEGVIQVIAYMMVFYLCASLVKKEKYKYFAMWFFLATGVVIAVLTIINEYITDVTIIGDAYICGIFILIIFMHITLR